MSDINIFEYATQRKFRFNYKGLLSLEDLWDLTLEALDEIAVALYQALQNQSISFIAEKTQPNTELEIKLEIVKRIIQVKMEKKAAAKAALERKQEKQRILELIQEKKDSALSALSLEELEQRLEAL